MVINNAYENTEILSWSLFLLKIFLILSFLAIFSSISILAREKEIHSKLKLKDFRASSAETPGSCMLTTNVYMTKPLKMDTTIATASMIRRILPGHWAWGRFPRGQCSMWNNTHSCWEKRSLFMTLLENTGGSLCFEFFCICPRSSYSILFLCN